jgi:hypothetical protein
MALFNSTLMLVRRETNIDRFRGRPLINAAPAAVSIPPVDAQRSWQMSSIAQSRKAQTKYDPDTREATHSVALVIRSMETATRL